MRKRGMSLLMPGLDMDDILDQDMAFKRSPSSPSPLGWM